MNIADMRKRWTKNFAKNWKIIPERKLTHTRDSKGQNQEEKDQAAGFEFKTFSFYVCRLIFYIYIVYFIELRFHILQKTMDIVVMFWSLRSYWMAKKT